jgi:hypothetical protein
VNTGHTADGQPPLGNPGSDGRAEILAQIE